MCGPVVYRKCVTVCRLWSFKISKTGPISLHLSPTCNTMQILSSFFSTLSACPLPCFLPWWSWTLTPVTINKFPVKCFFFNYLPFVMVSPHSNRTVAKTISYSSQSCDKIPKNQLKGRSFISTCSSKKYSQLWWRKQGSNNRMLIVTLYSQLESREGKPETRQVNNSLISGF